MAHSSGSDPSALDRPWRIWASIAVSTVALGGVLLGVLIIPVVQGRSDGIDAYTAICRALGILPGSPAREQVSDRTPPTPVSQVVWTPAILQILADAKPERGLAKAQEVCVACHGAQGVSAVPEFPHLAGQSGAAIYKQLNDYRTSCAWWSLAIPAATSRPARRATGPARAARSRRQFLRSRCRNTLSCN
jgi:cytochrome c553